MDILRQRDDARAQLDNLGPHLQAATAMIAELGATVSDLLAENGYLRDRIEELEATQE